MLGLASGFCWIWTILTSLWQICIDTNPREPAAACSLSLPTKRSLSRGRGRDEEGKKMHTDVVYWISIYAATSLGELRERMLNVNMNKWAEKRAAIYHISSSTRRAPFEGQLKKFSALWVMRSSSFGFNVTCCMQQGSKAARHVLQAGNNLRNRNRRRGSVGRVFGPLQARNSTLANDNAGRARFWHWISSNSNKNSSATQDTGRGNRIPDQGQSQQQKGAALGLSVSFSAAVVCVDDWFHGKVDFNQQMFMQFFFLAPFFFFFFFCFAFCFASWSLGGLQADKNYDTIRIWSALSEHRGRREGGLAPFACRSIAQSA